MNASAKDRPDIWMLMVFAVLFVVVVDINSPQRKREGYLFMYRCKKGMVGLGFQ